MGKSIIVAGLLDTAANSSRESRPSSGLCTMLKKKLFVAKIMERVEVMSLQISRDGVSLLHQLLAPVCRYAILLAAQ